ncbi:MAG: aminoacyl-tRNA hydrolase [Euzebyaceae bacterium]|nr:aminoacyl-tRNA hydrolase [Euzebyaceae bacterium]
MSAYRRGVNAVHVNRTVQLPLAELNVSFSRSGGPGGQHANTSSTKVELRWHLEASSALTPRQKQLVRSRLGSRLTDEGVLVLQSSEHRSQTRNREAAVARLVALLADALRVSPTRRPTRPTRAARQRRIEAKRRRGDTKALRRPPEA